MRDKIDLRDGTL